MAEQMYELQRDVSQNHRLYNKDLAPTTLKQRKWGTYNFAALWIGMAHCVPTYALAGGLIALGMDWKQAPHGRATQAMAVSPRLTCAYPEDWLSGLGTVGSPRMWYPASIRMGNITPGARTGSGTNWNSARFWSTTVTCWYCVRGTFLPPAISTSTTSAMPGGVQK